MNARSRRLGIGLSAMGAIAIAASLPGAAAGRPAGHWQLVDYHQSACFSARVTDSWYGIYIDGRWGRRIDVGASGLPSGGSFDTSYTPIPPGRSDGEQSLAYVRVQLPATTPVGTYTASLWAHGGKRSQAVPITMVVKASCGY
jgi:hypothetical protein